MTNSAALIEKPIFSLIGPTAIGKTELSLELCQRFNCEIISVDSMQVYRHMDIGTAKASAEERRTVPHHLIDIADPDESYNAARFVKDCLSAIETIHGKGAIPLLTGGTGLYLAALKTGLFDSPPTDSEIRDSLHERLQEEGTETLYKLLQGCDPEAAGRIHPNDSSRIIRALEVFLSTGVTMSEHMRQQAAETNHPTFKRFLTIGLTCHRDVLYRRINDRTLQLFELGLETEVRGLLEMGYGPHLQSMQSIGYRHMTNYINGLWSFDQCAELLARDTRRYAKRQFTWFNRDNSIVWHDRRDKPGVIERVDTFLHQFSRSPKELKQ